MVVTHAMDGVRIEGQRCCKTHSLVVHGAGGAPRQAQVFAAGLRPAKAQCERV